MPWLSVTRPAIRRPCLTKARIKIRLEIFEELRVRLERDEHTSEMNSQLQEPALKIDAGLRYGPYGKSHALSLSTLLDQPHGLDMGPLQPQLPERLTTATGRIDVVPALMLADLDRAARVLYDENRTSDSGSGQLDGDASGSLLLISRRHLRSNNSWMHNSHRLVKGLTVVRCK